jgi:hypothetical protein
VPPNWDYAWRGGKTGWVNTYVRDLGEDISKKMFPPIDYWNDVRDGYLGTRYKFFSTPRMDTKPPLYWRHVGWDNARPDNTPVYSLTTGQVTHVRYVQGDGYNNVVIVREEKGGVFQDRWWTYGHVAASSGINVGTRVAEGQQVGSVDGSKVYAHVHLTVHSTDWQRKIVDPTPPVDWGQGWGIAEGVTQEVVEWAATTLTAHPIHAYALYKGYDVD